MFTQITDNIYQILVDMSYSPLKNLNAYLIKGADRNLLIDTGDRQTECLVSLKKGLAELEIDMGKTDILLTHLHTDHTGLISAIAAPETKVFMSRTDINHTCKICRSATFESICTRLLYRGFGQEEAELDARHEVETYFTDVFEHFLPFEDGAIFEYGGHRLRSVSTPGHTPGHMCFFDEAQGILFSGDHVLFDITPNIGSWDGVEDSLGSYITSLVKIRNYNARIVLPAHRQASGSLAGRVDEIIEHHSARVQETEEVLRSCPGATAYEIAGRMHWNIRYDGAWENFPQQQKPFAVNEVLAHLDYLIARGRAFREVRDGIAFFRPQPPQTF